MAGGPVAGLDALLADLDAFERDVKSLVVPMTAVGDAVVGLAARHQPKVSRIVGDPIVSAAGVRVAYAGVLDPDRFTAAVLDEIPAAAVQALDRSIDKLITQRGLA